MKSSKPMVQQVFMVGIMTALSLPEKKIERRRRMRQAALCVLALLTVIGVAKPVRAQPYQAHVDQIEVKYVIARMSSQLPGNGMDGVSEDIKKCYGTTDDSHRLNNEMSLQECILYDITAKELDNAMRQYFRKNSGKDPGPATPYLADYTIARRIIFYSRIAFGNKSFDDIMAYYGNAPSQILNGLISGK